MHALLERFAADLREALGGRLVALYATGSAVEGGFEPASSDVDFLALLDGAPADDLVAAVQRVHDSLAAASPWGARLEGEYADAHHVGPRGPAGAVLRIEPGGRVEAHAASETTAENIAALRDGGVALVGPAPRALLPPVPRAALEDDLREYAAEIGARLACGSREPAAAVATSALDLARCLCTLAGGDGRRKEAAAAWLGAREPGVARALDAALAVRRGVATAADEEVVRAARSRLAALAPAAARPARTAQRGASSGAADIVVERLDGGSFEFGLAAAERIVLDFAGDDAEGFDSRAPSPPPERVVAADIDLLNRFASARSSRQHWAALLEAARHDWLAAVDPGWDLAAVGDAGWPRCEEALRGAFGVLVGHGRGLAVASKLLYLKRPQLVPMLDRLVVSQLAATPPGADDAKAAFAVSLVGHLRRQLERNAGALGALEQALAGGGLRLSRVRLLDILLWASHPDARVPLRRRISPP